MGKRILCDGEKSRALVFDLFLYADGTWTAQEKELFREICTEMKIPTDTQNIFDGYCRYVIDEALDEYSDAEDTEPDAWSEYVNDCIDDVIEGTAEEYEGAEGKLIFSDDYEDYYTDRAAQANLLWDLLSLGYSNGGYSNLQKGVIGYLCDHWFVDADIIKEMEDAMDTVAFLYGQRLDMEEIRDDPAARGHEDAVKRLNKIDEDINRVLNGVKHTFDTWVLFEDETVLA